MPPYISRKRSHSPSGATDRPPKRAATAATSSNRKPKARPNGNVFQAIDTLNASNKRSKTVEETRAYLADQEASCESDSDESSSDSDEFEDVFPENGTGNEDGAVENHEDDTGSQASEQWQDLLPAAPSSASAPIPSGDLQITLPGKDEQPDYSQWAAARETTGKKGPSKIERQIRVATHCMHVQFLLFHNLVRNSWVQDKEIKKILLSKLTEGCWKEIAMWREAAGLPELGRDGEVLVQTKTKQKEIRESSKENSRKSAKGKGKQSDPRGHRDWSDTATREPGNPATDPLPRLLKYLISFWKKTFRATAPSLKKIGYLEPATAQAHMRAFNEDPEDIDRFGEKISSLEEFREVARKGHGSRDVGQQLFTGLLRAVGIEARMVSSLQPVGFGWSKAEDGKVKKPGSSKATYKATNHVNASANEMEVDSEHNDGGFVKAVTKQTLKGSKQAQERKSKPASWRSNRGSKTAPIDVGTESSELSEPPSDSESDLSIIDITPSKVTPSKPKGYPQTHPFPTYWTEAISPTTHLPHAISPLTAPHFASTSDTFQAFEPRGKDAEKAKQVFAYVVAYSSDGTVKDVTIRYIKRRTWPGKTKGFRIPVEKVPVYNKKGKVRRYDEYDWFKTVLSAYSRDSRRLTQADEIEDTGDLVPVKPSKKDASENLDTLSGLKASADYVLERFLRREEALLPTAKVVRQFTSGKGDKAKTEPVYRRADIVTCKTVESWHKEGREVLPGSQALKRVPHRAVTLIRKQEIAEQERETGEKPLQGLYSKAQTKWIVPPPIENGVIPRNSFGNIDVYVPSMVPKGAVHLPLRGSMRICKKLNIDFAEACVGFEFGKQRAVPVIRGVVVAEENRDLVKDAWEEEMERQKKKEEDKRLAKALGLWKKFLTGMKIIERVQAEYGKAGNEADINPFVNKSSKKQQTMKHKSNESIQKHQEEHEEEDGGFIRYDEDAAGGFFLPGHEEEEVAPRKTNKTPVSSTPSDDEAGGFILEDGTRSRSTSPAKMKTVEYPRTPISLQSAHANPSMANGGDEDMVFANSADDMNMANDGIPAEPISRPSLRASGKSRGRGRGRGTKITPATSRKRAAPQGARPSSSKKSRKSKAISDEEDIDLEEEEEEELDLSPGITSDENEASDDAVPAKRQKRAGKRKAQSLTKQEPVRSVPRRNAKSRISAGTGTKSKYFESSDGSE